MFDTTASTPSSPRSPTQPVGDGEANPDIAGFSILDADSQHTVLGLLQDHPHLHTPGGLIELHEMLRPPGT